VIRIRGELLYVFLVAGDYPEYGFPVIRIGRKLLYVFGAVVVVAAAAYGVRTCGMPGGTSSDRSVFDAEARPGDGGHTDQDPSLPSRRRAEGGAKHHSTVAGEELVEMVLRRELTWEETMAALAQLKKVMPLSSAHVDRGYATLILGKLMCADNYSIKEKAEIFSRFGYEILEDKDPYASDWQSGIEHVLWNICERDVSKRREFAEALAPSKFRKSAFISVIYGSYKSVGDYGLLLSDRNRITTDELEGDESQMRSIIRDLGRKLYDTDPASREQLLDAVNGCDLSEEERGSLFRWITHTITKKSQRQNCRTIGRIG